MSVIRALEIEKLKPVKDGIYVCVNEDTKEFALIPLEQVNICVNGKKQPLGELLFSILEKHDKLIDILMENSEEVK